MRINFRQGIVSHQSPTKSESGYGSFLPGFMQKDGNNYNLIANDKPVTLTIAHKTTNYTFVEDSSVANAWIGPFDLEQNYWLYWNFNPLTFERTFGKTTVEPIAQSVEPGKSDAGIIQTLSGVPGVGRFVVNGHYAPRYGRDIIISGTESNDGTYTITSTTFDNTTGNTSIYVSENISENTGSGGIVAFDIDSYGLPLKTEDRHWYDTSTNTHKVWKGSYWSEVLRVFAVHITYTGSAVFPLSITHGTTLGTQIGDTSSVLTGRILYDEDTTVIRRDNGTFFTTEDQFFSGSSRVGAIRLESNVTRAQFSVDNAIAAFTPVAWYADGRCRVATYNDTGNTVVGMLMEDVTKDDVGSVVIQGVITNPEWNWSATHPNYPYVKVGDPLWIENGTLVPYDPHTTSVVQYPISRVPVARVLGTDTVIFEQGLGGKGERGPVGSLDNMPVASYDYIGGVFLSIDPEVPEDPIAVGDNDPRLISSFKHDPTPHLHTAASVTYNPIGNVQSENVQSALEELSTEKLNISGGTMTGSLTLSSDPTQPLQAASKQYVDGLVSGLLWTDPICVVNLIAIDVSSPPSQPNFSDAYIVPSFPTGAWAIGNAMNIQTGDLVVWNGSTWENRGPLESTKTYRFGVSMISSTPPAGVLSAHKNKIITALGSNINDFQVETPVNNTAVFVCNESSMYAYQQFAFKDTSEETKWINIGGSGGTATVVVDDLTISSQGNVIGTVDYIDGGTIDAKSIQGHTLTNLDSRYAVSGHTHSLDSRYAVSGHIHDLDSRYAVTDHTHDVQDHNHDGLYASLSHTHALDSRYAVSDHTHALDSRYAVTDHLHDSRYALLTHTHALDSRYAVTDHTHALDSRYATTTHSHDGQYAVTTHNHDGEYASTAHTHVGQYATPDHNHDGQYAVTAHTHDDQYYTKTYIDSNMLTKTNLNVLFETNNTAASITLDVTSENIFAHTLTQDVTFTIGGTSPQCHGITVILTLDSSGTAHKVNWPSNIKWASKLPPELSTTAGSTDIISLLTTDGGTSWYGFLSGTNFGVVPVPEAIQRFVLDNPDPFLVDKSNEYFGYSVDADTSWIVVGAQGVDDTGGIDSGKVYIYNNLGTLYRTLDNPNSFGTSAGDKFGNQVAVSGNYIMVGANQEDDSSGVNSGVVYIFTTNGTLIQTLTNPNAFSTGTEDVFGVSISMDGNYAIVGASGEDSGGTFNPNSGIVYIYHTALGDWSDINLAGTLTNPSMVPAGGESGPAFGLVVSLSGNYAIVSALSDPTTGGNGPGKAYIFDVTTATLVNTLECPSGFLESDWFSWSVAIGGNYALVTGKYRVSPSGPLDGITYLFDVVTGTHLHTFKNPNEQSTGNTYNLITFGTSLAINGNTAVIGASSDLNEGRVYLFDLTTKALIGTLSPSNPQTNGYYGISVAMSGSRIVVGQSSYASQLFNNEGLVELYTTDGTPYKQISNPYPYGGTFEDTFGSSVSTDGTHVVVGTPGQTTAGSPGDTKFKSGVAYIYDVTTGDLLRTIENPTAYGTGVNDRFGGSSVAIDGNYVVVCAVSEDDAGGSASGKAYIFNVNTGDLLHTLDNPNAFGTSNGDNFGGSSAISGNYVIIGAVNEDDAIGASSGKAYIFNITTGLLVHTLDNPDSDGVSAYDNFGRSVAISGNYAIVGAFGENEGAGNFSSGKAYIFDVTSGLLIRTLNNPNVFGTSNTDRFGYSVAIDGNYILVGATGEDETGSEGSGKAYIFDVTTGDLLHTLDNPNAYDTPALDQFGTAVGISGNNAFVAARYEDDAGVGGATSGKVYIFNITTGALVDTLHNPNPGGEATPDSFGYSTSIGGNYIVVGALGEDDFVGIDAGKAYIFEIT